MSEPTEDDETPEVDEIPEVMVHGVDGEEAPLISCPGASDPGCVIH